MEEVTSIKEVLEREEVLFGGLKGCGAKSIHQQRTEVLKVYVSLETARFGYNRPTTGLVTFIGWAKDVRKFSKVHANNTTAPRQRWCVSRTTAVDRKKGVLTVLLDMSVASNGVDH